MAQNSHSGGRSSTIQLFSNVCVVHSVGMGLDSMKTPPLLSHSGFFFAFGCKIFLVDSKFFFFFNFLMYGCSAFSCDFAVFVKGGELKSF